MIKKYRKGNPVKTPAVISEFDYEDIIDFKYYNQSSQSLRIGIGHDAIIYGLGQQVRGINKRGWKYRQFCSDDFMHTETKESLYGAHNFILIDDLVAYGIFIDTGGEVTFDLAFNKFDEIEIGVLNDFDLYFIEADSKEEVLRNFRRLIGKSYKPPFWAFGFGQSRWSYPDEKTVKSIIKAYDDNNLPLDMLYLDIDYMEDFKDFTIDKNRFSDMGGLIKEMQEKGIHLIPIIDAGVKIEDGYELYEKILENKFYVSKKDKSPFIGAVWPGRVVFPDFLNDDAGKYFASNYKKLVDLGFDGFWNDMNEPAIFYSEDRFKDTIEWIYGLRNQNVNINKFFELQTRVRELQNSIFDYRSMYHNIDGKLVNHEQVHNIYGSMMTISAANSLEKMRKGKRTLIFSRASSIGPHRQSGIWTGDNQSWWSHLELNIKMMPSLNMVGYIYTGADLGGFSSDTTVDLMLRWIQFGVFTPLMRNHAAMGTRNQELFRFDYTNTFKNLLEFRYALLPYIYSEFLKSVENYDLFMKPLSFIYKDDYRAREIEDQLFIGNLMIAPIYKQNTSGRFVYLPEDMTMYRIRSFKDMDCEKLRRGDHYIRAALDEFLIFIPEGKMIILTDPKMRTRDLVLDDFYYLGSENSSYERYYDDGINIDARIEIEYIYSNKSKRLISD